VPSSRVNCGAFLAQLVGFHQDFTNRDGDLNFMVGFHQDPPFKFHFHGIFVPSEMVADHCMKKTHDGIME